MGELENPNHDRLSFSDGEMDLIAYLTKLVYAKNPTGKLVFDTFNDEDDYISTKDFLTTEKYNKPIGVIGFFKYFFNIRVQIPEFRDLSPLNIAVQYPTYYWRVLLADYIKTEQPKFGKISEVGFNFKDFGTEVYKLRSIRIVRQAVKGVRGFPEPRLNNFELSVLEFIERKQKVIEFSMAKSQHEIEKNGNRWRLLYDWELMRDFENRMKNTDACQRSRLKKRVASQAKRNGILFSEKENQYFLKLLIYSYKHQWDLVSANANVHSDGSSSSGSDSDHNEQNIYTDSDYISGSPEGYSSSNSNESDPIYYKDYMNFNDEDEDSTDSYSTESCNAEGFNNLQQERYNNLQQNSYNNLQEESYNPEIYFPEIHIAESYNHLQQENTNMGSYNPIAYHTIKQENYNTGNNNTETYNNLQQESYMTGSFNTDSSGAIFCKQEIIDEYFMKTDNGAAFSENPGNGYLDDEYCMDVDISWLA